MAKQKYNQDFLERFVITWESCCCVAEVAEKMGMAQRQNAAQLASILRKNGVPLKSMVRDSPVDYGKLRALVDEHAAKPRRARRAEPSRPETPSEALDRDHH